MGAPAPNTGPCDASAAAGFTSTSSPTPRRPRHRRPEYSASRNSAGEGARDRRLGLLLDLAQVVFAAKALRIDLVDVLGPRRARREPAVLSHDLDAAERLTVAGRGRERRSYLLAAQFRHRQFLAGQRFEQALLLWRRRRIDPCVERHTQFIGQAIEQLAW